MLLALAIPSAHPLVTSPVAIFLIVLAIILLAPILLGKLKIPHVIGLILAGVAVGPYGMNILARDMSFEVFGQVGMLYLMFLAGIEIDMYHLKKNIYRGAVFGLFTFLTPLLLGAAAATWILGLPSIAATMLASMFAAHTLIAYPLVSRLGLTKSKSVVIAIAGTIFTVLGSLVVLAVTSAVATSEAAGHSVSTPVLLLRLFTALTAFCIGVLYIYPRLTRWFFKHYSDGILQFVYVLVMVFLAAVSAQWIGIEGVFGAFFAGIVLNRYVPARTPLMTRLEFVGNALFIPYFLIGVGMLINVGVIASGWQTLRVAALMCAVAMGGKWLAALLTQKIYSMRGVDRSMMYQLSNAHTAVALAVVMIGYNAGLFDEYILNGTVIMILATCTVSSLGTARAARRMKLLELESDISSSTADDSRKDPVPHTLVAVDNPQTAIELVSLALLTHDVNRRHSKIYALHVRNDNSAMSRSVSRSALDVSEKTAAAADMRVEPLERYDLNFVTGMLNTIEERDVGEVVLGLHRRSAVIDSFLGDKLQGLLRATNRMVVISRCYIPVNTFSRIVVAVPPKAEFETGFTRWVRTLGNLSGQLGCRLIFCCTTDTRRLISATLRRHGYEVRQEFRTMTDWDDFVLLSNKILDDDLFVVISSRPSAVSHTNEIEDTPDFLRRYFSRNNLLLIYPEQFGQTPVAEPSIVDTISTDIVVTATSPLWRRLNSIWRRISGGGRRNSDGNDSDSIEI